MAVVVRPAADGRTARKESIAGRTYLPQGANLLADVVLADVAQEIAVRSIRL